jgi:hypothetical protein
MELLIGNAATLLMPLLIVAFLLAYLMGEEAAKGPNIVIISNITDAPDDVWAAWIEKVTKQATERADAYESETWREEVAAGLNWSSAWGPTPLL